MICTPEEFLLLAQNWITDSAKVVFVLNVFGADPAKPAMALQEEGWIANVDAPGLAFSFSSQAGNVIVVDLSEWTRLGYADQTAFQHGESIKEVFTIVRPGASISLWTRASE